MSEIEKLYKNAGIKKYRLHNFVGFIPNGYKAVRYEYNPNKVKEIVRDFTAEKQLLLLQYIEKLDWIDAIVSFYYMNEKWVFLAQPIREFANEQYRDFDGTNAFAYLFNEGWTVEVIGNKFENPELLKECENE